MKKLIIVGLASAVIFTGCSRITDADVGIRQTFSGEIVFIFQSLDEQPLAALNSKIDKLMHYSR